MVFCLFRLPGYAGNIILCHEIFIEDIARGVIHIHYESHVTLKSEKFKIKLKEKIRKKLPSVLEKFDFHFDVAI